MRNIFILLVLIFAGFGYCGGGLDIQSMNIPQSQKIVRDTVYIHDTTEVVIDSTDNNIRSIDKSVKSISTVYILNTVLSWSVAGIVGILFLVN